MRKIALLAMVSLLWFCAGYSVVFAGVDLSIADSDITFSKNEPFSGDNVRIYARVFNAGDVDVFGYVTFLSNGEQISEKQTVSVKPNTYDDVFVDWSVKSGVFNIEAKIAQTNPLDENSSNNQTTKKEIVVDQDTDKDGIGDRKDDDIDGDGLLNSEEAGKKTNPLIGDTDGDGVNDKVDAFPIDKTEWRDTDSDGIGDNTDEDADGDQLTNLVEIEELGTNPLSIDTDGDGIDDRREVILGSSPNNLDTDNDGANDLADSFPLDESLSDNSWLDDLLPASLLGSVTGFVKKIGLSINQAIVILCVLSIIIMIFLFRKKRN